MPASAASVTERPLSRAKFAVCSKTNLYLSPALSRTLCRPLLRSIAGLAPDWPCRLMIVAPFGNSLDDQIALRLAALDVVGADMAENALHAGDAAVDGDDRHVGVDRLLQRRRHRVDVVRADDDAVDALGQRRLDVGGLLGRGVLAVALDAR